MTFTAAEIARHLEGQVLGDGATPLSGFAPADRAKPGDLTFAENPTYFIRAEASAAAAVLVDADFSSSVKTLIRVPNARIAFARVLPLFFPEPQFPPGVHPSSVVAASATVDASAHVGPFCVVGENAQLGPRSVLRGYVWVGANCRLAEDVHLFPHVTLYAGTHLGCRVRIHAGTVLGADGFGYVLDNGMHRKVPQMGNVVVQDDVEIGANVTVDRGALGPTTIGRGTKIDNLVQIGHNVSIGEHCLLISQTGIAGSTRLGHYCVLAGQSGLAGHLKIGNHVTISAQSGVMRDIPDGQKVLGAPALPDKEAKRQFIALQRLPEVLRRLAELEKREAARARADGSAAQ
jgi:UDP-3-O-[3-hydroxymyristoyl] glucosamine N-acyltransferase